MYAVLFLAFLLFCYFVAKDPLNGIFLLAILLAGFFSNFDLQNYKPDKAPRKKKESHTDEESPVIIEEPGTEEETTIISIYD